LQGALRQVDGAREAAELERRWRGYQRDMSVRRLARAYALGVHGRPRGTGDLDVWVAPPRSIPTRR